MNKKKYSAAIRCKCGHVSVFYLQAKTSEKVAELIKLYKNSVCSECLKKSASARGFENNNKNN